jgi:SAM-dependent methyltransferase
MHAKTTLVQTNEYPKKTASDLVNFISYWNKLGLFPHYLQNKSHTGQFGFVSARTNKTMLITGRGQSKNITDPSMLAHVLLNEDPINITCLSTQKATLNAPLAKMLYVKYPHINFIIHAHFFLPGLPVLGRSSQPGTINDIQILSELPLIVNGSFGFNQTDHGCFILLASLDQFPLFLQSHNLYAKGGQYYDLCYSRFIQGYDIAKDIPLATSILDYGGGTGALSKHLIGLGYKVELYDPSASMRKQAELISGLPIHSNVPAKQYGAVLLRQCINYIDPQKWCEFLRSLSHLCQPGGFIRFNTFKRMSENKSKSYELDTLNFSGLFTEHSILENDHILHTQRADLFYPTSLALFDFNQFYNTPENILDILQPLEREFQITLQQNNNSLYVTLNKL